LRRALTVAVIAVLAMGGLSACQTKVGLAASAAGHRLSDTDLNSYIKAGAAPYTEQGASTATVPKVFALGNWINLELFTAAVGSKGGPPKSTELAAARTAILGGRSVATFQKLYTARGYTKKFGDLILQQGATLIVLIERIAPGITTAEAISALQSGQANAELIKTVNAKKPKVEVSRRYGTWEPKNLALSTEPAAGLPSFVHYGPNTATAAEPTTAP
jgi:hypothetical protein